MNCDICGGWYQSEVLHNHMSKCSNGGIPDNSFDQLQQLPKGWHKDFLEKRLTENQQARKYFDTKTTPPTVGLKYDTDKPRMDLLSPYAINQLARVLTFGADKYDSHNWRKGIAYSRVIGAALRHIFSWLSGTDNDKETGINHLAHAMCNLMFLLEYSQTRKEFDDRYKEEKTETVPEDPTHRSGAV